MASEMGKTFGQVQGGEVMKIFSGRKASFGKMISIKPPMKGGHTHNHLKNMELRLMLTKKEIKALRKIMKMEKKK